MLKALAAVVADYTVGTMIVLYQLRVRSRI